jgi:hypothetical protein
MRYRLLLISMLTPFVLTGCSNLHFFLGTDSSGQPYFVSENCTGYWTKGITIYDTQSGKALWSAKPISGKVKVRFFRFSNSIPGFTVTGSLPTAGVDAYVTTGFGQLDWISSNLPNTFEAHNQTFAGYTGKSSSCAGFLRSRSVQWN